MPNRSRRFDKQDIPRKPGLIKAERLARVMFVQCLDTLACLTFFYSSFMPNQYIPKFIKRFSYTYKNKKNSNIVFFVISFPVFLY
jgi:hypothetical protein